MININCQLEMYHNLSLLTSVFCISDLIAGTNSIPDRRTREWTPTLINMRTSIQNDSKVRLKKIGNYLQGNLLQK